MSTTRIELELTPKEIEQLREVMDAQPLRPYAPLIVKVLKALPLDNESAPQVPEADSSPAAPTLCQESAGGFQTLLGKEALSEVMRRLLQTTQTPSFFPRDCSPHGESL